MEKTNCKKFKLQTGEISLYDFGKVKLHAYTTGDPIDDQVFLVEKNGKMVVIESPCFFDSISALTDYITGLGVEVEGVLVSYHAAGATFLPNAKKFATKHADQYGHHGGGKALIDNFTAAFGDVFDKSIHTTTDFLVAGKTEIGRIEFEILDTEEGFDIIIPEINVIYTHMLGHDCHSIVVGPAHADALISVLNGYLQKGYDLILTSHYTPENLSDVQAKILYLENLKTIAKESGSADEFKNKVNQAYPNYSGKNYLDMTASFFFK